MKEQDENLTDPMVFEDISPKEVPVTIGGQKYKLVQPRSKVERAYRNSVLKSTRMTKGQVSGIDGLPETEVTLLAQCFYKDGEKGWTLVTVKEIDDLPGEVQRKLFERLQKLAGLSPKKKSKEEDKAEETQLKN